MLQKEWIISWIQYRIQFCKDQLLNYFSSWCSYLEFVLLHQYKPLQTANYADHAIPYLTGMAIADIIPSPKSSLKILLNWFEDYHIKSNCDKSRLSGWDLVVTANINVNIISYIKSEKAQKITSWLLMNTFLKANQKISAFTRISFFYITLSQFTAGIYNYSQLESIRTCFLQPSYKKNSNE